MRWVAFILGFTLLALVVAACTSGSRQPNQWTRVHRGPSAETTPAPRQLTTNTLASGIQAKEARPAPAQDPALTSTQLGVPGWPGGKWLRLGEWAGANLGVTPKSIPNGSGSAYALETALGTLVLTPATRLASFEGITLWLGFAPVPVEGDCLFHEADLLKNVLPLLTPSDPAPAEGRRIVIDPGHGGENLGTRSVVPGLLEKDLTLDWALRLEPILQRMGWEVLLTRRDDRDLTLSERVQIADRFAADLFISLHFNSAFPQTEQAGLETYCTTPVGLPSTLTRNYEDDVTRAFPNNAHDEENLRIAVRLHRALLETVRMADRSVRRARFMGVLRTQQRPAVLIEAGYLSNPDEARRVAAPEYRQQLAEAVARGLASAPTLASTQGGRAATTAGRGYSAGK